MFIISNLRQSLHNFKGYADNLSIILRDMAADLTIYIFFLGIWLHKIAQMRAQI